MLERLDETGVGNVENAVTSSELEATYVQTSPGHGGGQSVTTFSSLPRLGVVKQMMMALAEMIMLSMVSSTTSEMRSKPWKHKRVANALCSEPAYWKATARAWHRHSGMAGA